MPYSTPGAPSTRQDEKQQSFLPYRNEEYLVDWDGPNDPENPQNWPFKKKVIITTTLSFVCLVCTFNSSIFASGQADAGQEFGVGEEVSNLGTALFIAGYSVGPIIFAPMSEQFGRKIPLLSGYFLMAIFTIAGATSKDIQTLMITRFFGGVTGSTPLVLVGSIFADFWSSDVRGIAVCLFAMATFIGPSLGPVVGSFVAESYLGWRWTLYLPAFMSFFMLIVAVFFYSESYPNTILAARARDKRMATGNFAWHHKSEEKPFRLSDIVTVFLTRPIKMFIGEPVVFLLTIYVSFVYAIIYLLLEAVPIAFLGRGWSLGVASLPFISLIIGCAFGAAIIIGFNPYYKRATIKNHGRPTSRARLPPMMCGGCIFPIGFYIFAFSADIKHGSVFWLVPCIGLVFVGCGTLTIFLTAINYLIDIYLMFSASAIAANTIVRSALAAALTMVGGYMFTNMTVEWASLLLALLATIMAPIPFFFFMYDERLRAQSKFAPTFPGKPGH